MWKLVLFVGVWVTFGLAQTDTQRLSIIYNALNGPNWKRNTNWLSEESACEWEGVICNPFDYHVDQLSLSANNLSGSLPDAGGAFMNWKELNTLDFSGNLQVTGTIPEQIYTLKNMIELNFSFMSLFGTLSSSLEKLSLQVLWFEHNHFSGTIPSEITYLFDLKNIQLGHNSLTGKIPVFGYPKGMSLGLAHNNLEGTISQEFNFMAYEIQNNNVGGTIPPFAPHGEPLSVHLSNNQFYGSLPQDAPHIIANLDFRGDNLSLNGILPSWLCGTSYFSFSKGNFTCPLPPCCSKLGSQCGINSC